MRFQDERTALQSIMPRAEADRLSAGVSRLMAGVSRLMAGMAGVTAHFRNGRSMVSESPGDDAALSRMASMAGVTEAAIDKKIDETCRYAISALVDGVVDPIIDAMVANGRDSRSEKLIVRKAICLRFAKRIGKILTEEVM